MRPPPSRGYLERVSHHGAWRQIPLGWGNTRYVYLAACLMDLWFLSFDLGIAMRSSKVEKTNQKLLEHDFPS